MADYDHYQNRIADLEVYLKKLEAENEQLEEMMRGANALIVLWETRATRAEQKLASKREENSDVGPGFRGNNDYA